MKSNGHNIIKVFEPKITLVILVAIVGFAFVIFKISSSVLDHHHLPEIYSYYAAVTSFVLLILLAFFEKKYARIVICQDGIEGYDTKKNGPNYVGWNDATNVLYNEKVKALYILNSKNEVIIYVSFYALPAKDFSTFIRDILDKDHPLVLALPDL